MASFFLIALPLRLFVLFHALILFHGLGGDGRGRLTGAVRLLNVRGGSGDGSPSLATTDANRDRSEHQQ